MDLLQLGSIHTDAFEKRGGRPSLPDGACSGGLGQPLPAFITQQSHAIGQDRNEDSSHSVSEYK